MLIRNLILYITRAVADLGGNLGVTRLVKLLYLVEYEYYRRYQQRLSDLSWIFYKYGPYSFEIEAHLQSLHLDLTEEDIQLSGGRAFRRLSGVSVDVGLNDIGGNRVRIVVDAVVQTWAVEQLNSLLSYVYFETEPMRNPTLGERLDFALIPRRSIERRYDESRLKLSDDEVAELKGRLEAYRAKRQMDGQESQRQRERIHQDEDAVYEEARHIMNDAEVSTTNTILNVSLESPEP